MNISYRNYFDEDVLKLEKKLLFNKLKYLGHANTLKDLNIGSFSCLSQENNARMLMKTEKGISLLSNICRHRQAVMLNGNGMTENIICPLHGWTYNLNGELIGSPSFDPCPTKKLTCYDHITWNDLIFEKTVFTASQNFIDDLNKIKFLEFLNFTNYVKHSTKEHTCDYNWKTFIEVYLDDYHVKPFHPGLGSFVDCNNLEWQFGKYFSIQSVGIYNNLNSPGTPIYKKWHENLLKYKKGSMSKYGAIWLTIYPNIMIEWYPEVLVISTLWPESPQKTKNIVEFYYPEDICYFEREFVQAHQAAYMETCEEDDEIAKRMDNGRRFLADSHINDFGPIHNPMESGLEYFYEYYNNYIK